MRSTKPHVTRRRRSYRARVHDRRTRPERGNAALCPRCGGDGTVWDGGKRTTCPKCGGTGKKPIE